MALSGVSRAPFYDVIYGCNARMMHVDVARRSISRSELSLDVNRALNARISNTNVVIINGTYNDDFPLGVDYVFV